jgi:RNA polymerase sigma factor (sigma-70 family)
MEDAPSDEDLMSAYLSGDDGAFGVLFLRLAPRVHAFFARTFRSTATVDDLVQVTFMKIHQARASFERDRKVRPWVFSIAAHVRADELRPHYRSTEGAGATAPLGVVESAPETRPDARVEASEKAERVRRALESLPDSQRVVVLLHRYEGMTFSEIAAVLSPVDGTPLTDAAIRIRAFRAYETLRRTLADLGEGSAS